jgi:hypothetical protein
VVEHLAESVTVPSVMDSLTARAELTLATGGFGMSVRQRRFAWKLRETVLLQEPIGGASAAPGGVVRVDLSYPLGFMVAITLPLVGGGVPAGTWLARKVLKKDPGQKPPPADIRVEPADAPMPTPELEFPSDDDFVRLAITLDFLDWTFESVVDGTNDLITLDQERTDA